MDLVNFLTLLLEICKIILNHSDCTHKFSEVDIIKKVLGFLIDNIYVVVFQQTAGIPMGTNCAPLLADLIFIII